MLAMHSGGIQFPTSIETIHPLFHMIDLLGEVSRLGTKSSRCPKRKIYKCCEISKWEELFGHGTHNMLSNCTSKLKMTPRLITSSALVSYELDEGCFYIDFSSVLPLRTSGLRPPLARVQCEAITKRTFLLYLHQCSEGCQFSEASTLTLKRKVKT